MKVNEVEWVFLTPYGKIGLQYTGIDHKGQELLFRVVRQWKRFHRKRSRRMAGK